MQHRDQEQEDQEQEDQEEFILVQRPSQRDQGLAQLRQQQAEAERIFQGDQRYRSIVIADNSIVDIDLFRQNEQILNEFFSSKDVNNEHKLREWKRIKEVGFKHSGDAVIDKAEKLMDIFEREFIDAFSSLNLTIDGKKWKHTDRRGKEVHPKHLNELSAELTELENCILAKQLILRNHHLDLPKLWLETLDNLATVIRIREMENSIFLNVYGESQVWRIHQAALSKNKKLHAKLSTISKYILMTIPELKEIAKNIKASIKEKKKQNYYQKYLKYKEKYLALKKTWYLK